MMGKLSLGVLAALVIVLAVVLFRNYGNRLPGAVTGTDEDRTGMASADDEWALNNTSNQIDGDIAEAKKRFAFPDQKSLIDVSLTCVPKTKDIKIQIESYNDTAENGEAKSNAFVAQIDESLKAKPVGRIKFGDRAPSELSALFSIADYNNVMAWDVEVSAQGSAFFDSLLNHDVEGALSGNVGAGNFLQPRLPMVIEVKNSSGTEQVTIPSDDDAVNSVIQKCFVEKSVTPAGADTSAAPLVTQTVGGTPTEVAQPSNNQQSPSDAAAQSNDPGTDSDK